MSNTYKDPAQLARDFRILTAQRENLEKRVEQVHWVRDASRTSRLAVMLKQNGTLFFLDLQKDDWIALYDGFRFSQVLKRDLFGNPPGHRALVNE